MQKHYLLRSHTFSFWCVLLLPLFISGSVLAQTGTSSVRGTIQDPQGSAIAGATVTLTSIETNAARTQTTSDSGVYAFELIPPGEYRVEAEASGFKKALVNALDSSTTRATVHDGFQLHTRSQWTTLRVCRPPAFTARPTSSTRSGRATTTQSPTSTCAISST
ncbi:MAG: carboxypeptidase regulatory-like domain-containing protein [Pyrinomonadaceae bacterium]|nr:carboxypeptidase regulatory-like domain-containing protein [Pyrinomonadaceae bacterium]